MTTTDTNARLMSAFVAFTEAVRTEYALASAEALTAAHSGQYEQGRALLASFDDLTSLVGQFVEGFADPTNRADQVWANDSAANAVQALVPCMSELCHVLDEHDPVTIERSERALLEVLGEEQFLELQAAGEV